MNEQISLTRAELTNQGWGGSRRPVTMENGYYQKNKLIRVLNNQGGKWTKWELTRAGIMLIMKQQKMSNTIYLYFNKLEDMIALLMWPRSNMFIHLSSVIWPFTSPLRWPLKFWIRSASWMLCLLVLLVPWQTVWTWDQLYGANHPPTGEGAMC